jgi:hypothetical protein
MRIVRSLCLYGSLIALSVGLSCPGTTDEGGAPLIPPVAGGNTPPRVLLTGIETPEGNNFAEVGELVTINFTGQDSEDTANVRIFASQSSNPSPAQEIPILNGFPVGPGVGSGITSWNTAGVPSGSYNIFAEIDDGTNPPVRVISAEPVQIAPPGSSPLNVPPQIVLIDPLPNMGLSAQDDVTVRYIYADPDSPTTVTLLLDKDLNPNNDDINNPGDPFDPNSNIIILPTTALLPTDPTGDADLRRNPRSFANLTSPIFPFPGAPLAGVLVEYRFQIDFSRIPVRAEPYHIRATISDGNVIRHAYALGSISINQLAQGTVDVSDLGFSLAGARFQGFSAYENLGTDFVDATDLDSDGVGDFMIASRFGSPRNRLQPGAAYLIFGRKKTPFPPDTNGNGLPDVIDNNGNVVDYPPVPTFLPNPYDSRNVGRFGGIISINSVSSFFRGTTYAMPEPRFSPYNDPPFNQLDPDHVGIGTAGLTSITRIDLSGDGVPDLVFGLPFISGAYDHIDDDPVDGSCDRPYGYMPTGSLQGLVIDHEPNHARCDEGGQHPSGNDDMGVNLDDSGHFLGAGDLDQGLVIMVDGTSDLRNTFRKIVDAGLAGQFDEAGAEDDEFVVHGAATIPDGFRIRGGWHPERIVNDTEIRITNDNEYGATVAALPSIDNDLNDELIISSPGQFDGRGEVTVWLGGNLSSNGFYGEDGVKSLPGISDPSRCGGMSCLTDNIGMPPQPRTFCNRRCFVGEPQSTPIVGEMSGDRLGYGGPAGQFNQDGVPDILAGAPGASRNGLSENGIFYVFFTAQGGFGPIDLSVNPPPHLKIIGTHNNDHFGRVQTEVRDMNGDGIDDVAFASENFDTGAAPAQQNVGYVGVIFGDRGLTGENTFSPMDVGTAILPGVKFFGAAANALAGHDITSAGDFNNDGFGDLLISCPGETRSVGVQTRLGVVYLVFGGLHLVNGSFNLSQVGTPALPGIVFIGRAFQQDPNADVAPLETVGGIGDVDGDGFDDIMIGAPHMDFVNPDSPNQRRVDAGEVYLIYGSNVGTNALP